MHNMCFELICLIAALRKLQQKHKLHIDFKTYYNIIVVKNCLCLSFATNEKFSHFHILTVLTIHGSVGLIWAIGLHHSLYNTLNVKCDKLHEVKWQHTEHLARNVSMFLCAKCLLITTVEKG